MRSLVDEPPFVQYDDAIGFDHGGEAVGDDHDGAPLGEPARGLTDLALEA